MSVIHTKLLWSYNHNPWLKLWVNTLLLLKKKNLHSHITGNFYLFRASINVMLVLSYFSHIYDCCDLNSPWHCISKVETIQC